MSTFDKKQNEEGTSPERKIVQWLNEMIEGSSIDNQLLYIEDNQLEVEPHVMQMKNGVAQVAFVLRHPIFQEEIVESVAGVGPTSDEAFKSAAIQFVDSAFNVIQNALNEKDGQEVIVKVGKEENSFKLYQSKIKQQGHKKQEGTIDYWGLLGEELIKRLGHKRIYFIKFYLSKVGEAVNCECRVNGMVYPIFSRILKRVASSWDVEGKAYTEKQYFVLVQDEHTYKPYPLTKKEVDQFVLSSLMLYRQCDSQEAYDQLKDQISQLCPLPSLAEELFNFVPEVFTEVIFNEAIYLDSVILVKGEEELHISKHQLTAYDWIHTAIEKTIRAGYYEKEQVDRIISCSASLKCINEAIKAGSQLENLYTSGIAIPINETYEIL